MDCSLLSNYHKHYHYLHHLKITFTFNFFLSLLIYLYFYFIFFLLNYSNHDQHLANSLQFFWTPKSPKQIAFCVYILHTNIFIYSLYIWPIGLLCVKRTISYVCVHLLREYFSLSMTHMAWMKGPYADEH